MLRLAGGQDLVEEVDDLVQLTGLDRCGFASALGVTTTKEPRNATAGAGAANR